MESDTMRYEDVDAYWRRRVVALGGMLATVGLMVWACMGPGGERNRGIRGAAAVAAATSAAPKAGSAPTRSAPSQVVLPTVTVTVTATTRVTVMPRVSKRAGDACDTGDVVVNLSPTKDAYAKGDRPQFTLSVVNTGQRACTFGVGPAELQVLISAGSRRVWSSDRCLSGAGSSIQMLRRGIPYSTSVYWDRKRSAPAGDCSALREDAPPGGYTVMAKGGGIKTKAQVFQLR